MSKFLLPKPHLSWSQMEIWTKNPERYKREYFENAKKLDTKYLQFGKGIAKSIEDGSYKEILPDLVVYKFPEYKIEAEIQGVPVLSYVDSYYDESELNPHVFREYKTGKHPWTQAKVQKHGQLLFYAVGLRAKIGTMPEYCDLDWIETAESSDSDDFWSQADKKLELTGKMQTFRRYFDERELERMEAEIVKVATEISEAYKKFIEEI